MPNNLAVVDLGSNTFHLLITDEDLNEIHRDRAFVSLAEDGIERISDASVERGVVALTRYRKALDKYGIKDVKVFGTSALRSASNAPEIKKRFADILGSEIEIIHGKREAALIAKGISLLFEEEQFQGNHLLIDIGGGSTEFNLISDGDIIFSESYDLGIGVMYNLFHKEDPISESLMQSLFNYLESTTADLIESIGNKSLDSIIGSSGTFETFAQIQNVDITQNKLHEIDVASAVAYMNEIIKLDYVERAKKEHISESRARFIVEGYLLVLFYIKRFKPEHIFLSPYAIKEGVLKEIIDARK